ncbi:MAG: hypothetical protein VB957_16980 [Pseudomonadales bacterium]
MGYSGLFQEWAIPVASAISWLYDGQGGDFEYWPDGFGAPSMSVSPPYFNYSVLADNEYMYHRVGAMGSRADYLDGGISSESLLHRGAEGWDIRLGDQSIHEYQNEQIRISILWKAFCFKDQRMADQFNDPTHNISPEKIVAVFCEDLKGRGISFQDPGDLETDEAWRKVVLETYSAPEGAAY